MEERRRRLAEDLRDVIEGDVRTDRTAVALYSTDASLFEVEPLAVVCPRTVADVEKLASYSAEQKIPLTARGSGTGLAGGALGSGIVIDFSRHMNRLVSIQGDQVRVQPGVLRDRLNQQLRRSVATTLRIPPTAALRQLAECWQWMLQARTQCGSDLRGITSAVSSVYCRGDSV